MLSHEAVLEAAVRILDSEGLDAVTMRRVADELDTGPGVLYAHVAHKDDLIGSGFGLDLLVRGIASTVRTGGT